VKLCAARQPVHCYNGFAISCGYQQQPRERVLKQIVEFLESFIIVGLVLAGITGISYNLFRADGWIAVALGKLVDAEVQYPLIAIPVTLGAIVMFRLWSRDRVIHGKTSKLPNLVLYALVIAGAYYVGRYAITGGL
jgi:hypothetical protein